jgi:riboflavin kinase / FMN adenylyltransferase
VAAIGNFDGVHLGHRRFFAVVAEARALGARAVAITFDPHPEQFLRPARRRGCSRRCRAAAAAGGNRHRRGAGAALRRGSGRAAGARVCASDILVGALGVRSLHEGGNFRFGHGARPAWRSWPSWARSLALPCTFTPRCACAGWRFQARPFARWWAAGDMRRARWMLGRPFAVLSTQARGRGIGTRLLVPTVNLAAYDGLLPAFGVYVTRLTVGGRAFRR